MPQASHRVSKVVQLPDIAGNTVVLIVSAQHRCQPVANLRCRVVHAPSQLFCKFVEFAAHPLCHRLPKHDELFVLPALVTRMCEAKKVESLGPALSTPLPSFGGEPSELDHARFLGMQFQVELAESLPQLFQEPPGILFMLETDHEVIRVTYDDHIAARLRLSPLVGP